MIQEFWDFLTTSSSKQARENGYLYQSIALAHRARRCHRHWLKHLEECHDFLNTRLPKIKKDSRVAILGSGLMLETPPEILIQHFEHIDLVDVVHTKNVRDLISRFSLSHNQNHRFHFIEIDLNQSELKGDYDFVISANLLSQLPQVMIDRERKQRLKRQRSLLRSKDLMEGCMENDFEEGISFLIQKLQLRHLEQVKSLSKKHLIFSDFELNIRDLKNSLIETSATVDPQLNIKWEKNWSWNLAPAPEISKNHSVELIVGAYFS